MFKPKRYIKELPKTAKKDLEVVIRLPRPQLPAVDIRRWASTLLIVFGLFLIADQIVWPLITVPKAEKPLLKPEVLAEKMVNVRFEFKELKHEAKAEELLKSASIAPLFYITIPKLGIKKAEVDVNSESLSPDKRLGHYAGSALPGEVGNTFIYGHSALPIFFDPKNYFTIFSTLDKLEKDDEVTVEFGDRYFKYVVEKSVVLNPEDVRPLDPVAPTFLRQSYLTLMTCVPPGLKTKRLLVHARLVL